MTDSIRSSIRLTSEVKVLTSEVNSFKRVFSAMEELNESTNVMMLIPKERKNKRTVKMCEEKIVSVVLFFLKST